MEGDPGQSYPWMLHSSHADCACLLDCGKFVILNHRGLNAQIDKIKTKSNSMRISKKNKTKQNLPDQMKISNIFFFFCAILLLCIESCLLEYHLFRWSKIKTTLNIHIEIKVLQILIITKISLLLLFFVFIDSEFYNRPLRSQMSFCYLVAHW